MITEEYTAALKQPLAGHTCAHYPCEQVPEYRRLVAGRVGRQTYAAIYYECSEHAHTARECDLSC